MIRDEYQSHGLQSREVKVPLATGVLCVPSVGLLYKVVYEHSKSSGRTVNGDTHTPQNYGVWIVSSVTKGLVAGWGFLHYSFQT